MKFSFPFLAIILLIACKESNLNTDLIPVGYDFYPANNGIELTYSVTEIVIDEPSDRYDTTEYELKTVFTKAAKTPADSMRYFIERYIKPNGQQTFKIKDVWELNKHPRSVVLYEENIPYIKLSFPVATGTNWDGNAMNINAEQDYEITEIAENINFGPFSFDSVATIIQADNESSIDKNFAQEKYAKGVGMIEKEIIDVYANLDPGQTKPIMERISTGYIYKQKLISHNKNGTND